MTHETVWDTDIKLFDADIENRWYTDIETIRDTDTETII